MKYLVASVILFFCTLQTFGQQEYFIYLQTENSQAFYVRIKNTVYSSTASGFLILSKLPDSTTSVTIGFAKNVYPEQQFNIPLNHKDAGYLVKNFSDKGFGLFNLQTLAVIMNSNPPEEKKSPEITGNRKTDPFSLLLANAVNDTAVLYTVNRPKKPAPSPAVAEKKNDTAAVAVNEIAHHDSTAVAKKPLPQTDSTFTKQIKRDSTIARVVNANATKKDTASHAPGSVVKTGVKDKNTVVKTPPAVTGKNVSKEKKDSIIVLNNTAATAKKTTGIVKNNKERKDTIILMNNKPVERKATVAKNTTPKKPVEIKKDNPPVLKETTVKPFEKDAVAVNTQAPAKKDSMVAYTPANKDSITEPVVNAVNKPVSDTVAVVAKRTGPLVTKAAELFTDTSYVAVFVDESKEAFDTIRISIPFNEQQLRAGQQAVAINETKQPAVVKDSTPPAALPAKRDTPVTIVKDSTPAKPAAAVKDTGTGKPVTTTTTAALPAPVPTVKKDTAIPEAADSGMVIKAPQQALVLNSDCREIAWDSDIDKLRIKMLVVTADDEKIALAKKVFRQKCFSVKQVRALSELFKSDEGKYKWFDAVYPFVTDTNNFASLGEQIKGDYYLNRFKAMLRN